MSGYTKLFGSILRSTVWKTPPHVRLVWITMLALADRDGIVDSSVPGLADAAGVERTQCDQALALFLAPDPDSRTPDNEGRRIEKVDGGWRLLNHTKYQQKLGLEERRERDRERQARCRALSRSRDSHALSHEVTPVTTVTPGHAKSDMQLQHQTQHQTHLEDRESDARAPDPGPSEPRSEPTPVAGESLTQRAERVRLLLRKEYQARGLVVPTMDLSVPHSGHVLDLTRAFDGRGDLGSCLDGFFSDDRAAAAGFPVAWLAKNPNAYLAKRPRNAKNPRANSEYRDRVLTMDELLDGAGGSNG